MTHLQEKQKQAHIHTQNVHGRLYNTPIFSLFFETQHFVIVFLLRRRDLNHCCFSWCLFLNVVLFAPHCCCCLFFPKFFLPLSFNSSQHANIVLSSLSLSLSFLSHSSSSVVVFNVIPFLSTKCNNRSPPFFFF